MFKKKQKNKDMNLDEYKLSNPIDDGGSTLVSNCCGADFSDDTLSYCCGAEISDTGLCYRCKDHAEPSDDPICDECEDVCEEVDQNEYDERMRESREEMERDGKKDEE
jgi:hypothetical protein